MKKLIAIALAVMSLCLLLAGCQTETPNDPTPGTTNPPASSTDFALDPSVGYKISGFNADGELWFTGTITSGRFDASANKADAALVYVEIVDGGCLMYINEGSAKKYINMDDKSAGASFVNSSANATVYEWNETLKTLVVADPENGRAFGCQDTSTYANFSSYATSNTSGYNWGQFIAD